MAVARRNDPQTSWDAARSVRGITESQRRVYAILLEFGPMDDTLIARRHGERFPGVMATLSGLRTRRSELAAQGLVIDTGKRTYTPSNRQAIVWRARDDSPPGTGGLFDPPPLPEDVTYEPSYQPLPDD